MISVRSLGNDMYAVIDGMHRTSSLQALSAEKHIGIDYEHVPSIPYIVFVEPVLSTVLTHIYTSSALTIITKS